PGTTPSPARACRRGTQAPRHRLHAPVDAVEELERAVPELAGHRRSVPADIDRATVETDLAVGLPDDHNTGPGHALSGPSRSAVCSRRGRGLPSARPEVSRVVP